MIILATVQKTYNFATIYHSYAANAKVTVKIIVLLDL